MLFAVASHAKTLVPQVELEQVLTESDQGYGAKCSEWFARYDRDSCSWRTRQLLLFEDSDESWVIWPRWGMMRNGACYRPLMSNYPTFENESGFWPTPQATDGLLPISPKTMERKENGGCRPSGAKIGFCLKWDRRVIEKFNLMKYVSPTLHEWLMDWPLSWTALRPLETDKFQQWLNSHGKL